MLNLEDLFNTSPKVRMPGTAEKYRISFLLVLMLLGASLRAVFKYFPAPAFIAIVMFCTGFYAYAKVISLARRSSLSDLYIFQRPRILCTCLIIAVTTASYVIYPLADARKSIGAGSTADDGIILSAHSFLTSGSMYAKRVDGYIPISAGPGWILLNLPFANSRWYWLLSPTYIILSLLVYSSLFGSARQSALVLCLAATSLLFWELLTTGHDIVALGFVFPTLAMLTWKLSQHSSTGFIAPIALGIVTGLIATSRILFSAFPMLLALFAWKSNRKVSCLVGGIGILTVAVLQAYFFFTSNDYQPLHLFSRGKHNVGWDLITLGVVAEGFALAYAYWHMDNRPANWLHGMWLCLFIPLFLISLGELRNVAWDFAKWEGANYIFPCVPCYLFFVATSLLEPSEDRSAAQFQPSLTPLDVG